MLYQLSMHAVFSYMVVFYQGSNLGLYGGGGGVSIIWQTYSANHQSPLSLHLDSLGVNQPPPQHHCSALPLLWGLVLHWGMGPSRPSALKMQKMYQISFFSRDWPPSSEHTSHHHHSFVCYSMWRMALADGGLHLWQPRF